MKNLYLIIGAVIIIVGGAVLVFTQSPNERPPEEIGEDPSKEAPEAVSVIAEGLDIPWDIAFLPDGDLLVTERGGKILRLPEEGSAQEISTSQVTARGEGGLLGVVLHPDFARNGFVYFYMTAPGEGGQTENRVERYRLEGNELVERREIISGIPGAQYHDGGRMEFGPPSSCESGRADCLLYITTGDATVERLAQDRDSLAGKILRIRDDGSIPEGNPFGTAVYSYGHRNPQGLAWDDAGRLWETEHGRSGILSGLDEINLIEPGKNYGWPEIEGDETKEGMIHPARHSGSSDTWAPASAAYLDGSLFFGGLRGEALYEATLNGDRVTGLREHFKGEFGRIRTVRVGPDDMLYLTTSNRDGRGSPRASDDRIIRIDPSAL